MNTPYQSATPHLHRFHVFHRLLHVVAALALCLSLFPPLRLDARETAATLTQSTGTVTLTIDALAASEVMASSTLPLFKMTGSYSGNSENRRVKVNDFWLNFEASPEVPLDSAQLNALLSNLSVYRDDGDLSFNPATDTPIVTTDSLVVANGYLHFVLPDNAVTFSDSAYEAQPTYFVVARIAPTAATATPHQFIATFTNDGAYKPNCQDVLDLTPIAPELPPGVATGLVTLVADTSPLQPGPIFTVNSAADDDGTWCTANNCTLRAAINAANMHPNGANRDEIHFLIPGAGIQTIHPQAQLPGLDDTVILDGYTQPGAQPNSSETGNDMVVKIELRGDTAAASSGLTLYAPDIIVQGLAIAGYAYGMSGGVQPNALLFGNRIGTDATGSVAIPGTLVGIYLVNAYTPAIVGNQIAGATETAIVLDRGAYAVLQANLIGTNATGDAVLGNSGDGIALNEHYNAQVTANVIGGVGYGLRLRGAATVETTILQNAIGVNTTGGAGVALPNRGYGIWIAPESGTGTPSTVLIGNDAGGMNAIANSGLAGIRIESGQRITIRGTTIISSGGLGIDIGAPGPQPNDLLDADTGPNALQNFPVIDSAVENDGTVITGHISSTPNTELRIDAYVNSRCNPSSYGEGATWAGSFVVTTDVEGYAAFSGGLSGNGAFITAIATDPAGNSSEFSRCLSSGDAANNDTWPRAMPLALTADASGALTNVTNQYLSMPSQSRWYKLAVQPGSQVIVNLRDLPDNYDVVLYRDIAAAYNKLTAPTNPNLVQLGAQFAPDMFSPDMFSPDMFSPDMFSPDMFSPDMFSPDMFSPDMFSPDMFSPDMFSPDMFSPDMFSPDMFSPDMFSPDMFSSAQTTSMFKVSGSNGRSDELIVANTWNETGDFYIRVRGRNGVYNFATPFTLQTTLVTGTCANVSTDLPATTLTATAGNSQTIILTDLARMQGSDEEKATLL